MLDFKTILVIFGVFFLLILFTRKAILKQKASPAPGEKPKDRGAVKAISAADFQRAWKSLGYLLFLAAAGHLYVLYLAVRAALESGSYVYWVDSVFCLASAVAVVMIWRRKRQGMVLVYAGLTILPIFFFMSTGHSLEALMRLFPLVLVYLVVQPVWPAMSAPPEGLE